MQIIQYLKEPVLVANIQKAFGVKVFHAKYTQKQDHSSNGKLNFEITNKFWYYLFLFGTALGDEVFYSCFIPFWFWNIDGAVGRRVVLVWMIVMYIGTFTLTSVINL